MFFVKIVLEIHEEVAVIKEMTLLDFVETYPDLEDAIRSYDQEAGVCLLCQALFSTLEEIQATYGIQMHDLILKALKQEKARR